jgi:membrane fusion protein, copper/silver efflux system
MKSRPAFLVFILVIILGAGIFTVVRLAHRNNGDTGKAHKILFYRNPMNPGITSPVFKKDEMGMDYLPVYEQEKKVLFYRNPMNPEITSPVFKKDEMGMDYIPVYADTNAEPGVAISPDKQQAVGIKTEKTVFHELSTTITASGKVAYDPDLYLAQSEYLQSLKTVAAVSGTSGGSDLSNSLISAGRRKLQLQGMSLDQIAALERSGKPQEDLTLPGTGARIWVYLQVYEKDIGLVSAGMPVLLESIAYPGISFEGKIASLAPVLDPETRSLQVRVRVLNTGLRLKPEMFVNARIQAYLGERLAVPEESIVDTGTRKIVFRLTKDDQFVQKEVHTGITAGGYTEILSGISKGDRVVSSGVFFVDSETKLRSPGPGGQ